MDPITLAAIIGGGGSVLSSIMGNVGQGKRQRKTARAINKTAQNLFKNNQNAVSKEFKGYDDALSNLQELGNEFQSESLRSYFDTTEGKALTKEVEKTSKRQKDKLREESNLMGLSSEAYLAGLGRINESEGDAMSGIASRATSFRDSNDRKRMGVLDRIISGFGGKASMKNNMYNQAYGNAANMYGMTQAQQQAAMNNLNQGFQSASMLPLLFGEGSGSSSGSTGSSFVGLRDKFGY